MDTPTPEPPQPILAFALFRANLLRAPENGPRFRTAGGKPQTGNGRKLRKPPLDSQPERELETGGTQESPSQTSCFLQQKDCIENCIARPVEFAITPG
jgi:hypothetical protein